MPCAKPCGPKKSNRVIEKKKAPSKRPGPFPGPQGKSVKKKLAIGRESKEGFGQRKNSVKTDKGGKGPHLGDTDRSTS